MISAFEQIDSYIAGKDPTTSKPLTPAERVEMAREALHWSTPDALDEWMREIPLSRFQDVIFKGRKIPFVGNK